MRLIVAVFFTLLTLQFPTDLDTAVSGRLNAFNAVDGNPLAYRALGRSANDDGAIIYLQPVSKTTGEAYPGIVDWAVALRRSGGWAIRLPGDPDYAAAYEQLPSDVLSRADSTPYTVHADPSLDADLSGYQFP